jgi:hypothetical protein
MTRKPTQLERVIAASRSFRGVAQVDFLAPNVCDGGTPITRLAARIEEAKDRGYAFDVIGTRSKCRVYRLADDAESGRRPEPPHPPAVAQPAPALSAEKLFEVGPSQYGFASQEEAA